MANIIKSVREVGAPEQVKEPKKWEGGRSGAEGERAGDQEGVQGSEPRVPRSDGPANVYFFDCLLQRG